MEQFLEILIIALQAAQDHTVVVRQGEKSPGHPSLWNHDPQTSSVIVVENPNPFKAEVLQESLRVALDL